MEHLKRETEASRSTINDMFLCQKFEKEYRIVVNNMSNEEEGWSEESPIPYRPCGSVLTTLGFLPPDMPQESEDY